MVFPSSPLLRSCSPAGGRLRTSGGQPSRGRGDKGEGFQSSLSPIPRFVLLPTRLSWILDLIPPVPYRCRARAAVIDGGVPADRELPMFGCTSGAPLPLSIRHSETIPGMDELSELEYNGHWRMAVWALRVGYVGLAVAIPGLIVLSLGSTPWILTVGVFIWLAAAVVMAVSFLRSRHELPEPRPGFWSMRFKLIHDTVHARSSAQRS